MLKIHPEGWDHFVNTLCFQDGRSPSPAVSLACERVASRMSFAVIAKVHDEFAEMNPLLFQMIPQHSDMVLNKLSDLFAGYFNGSLNALRNCDQFDLYTSESGRVHDNAGRLASLGS